MGLLWRIYRKTRAVLGSPIIELKPPPETVDPKTLPASEEFPYKTLCDEIQHVCFVKHHYPQGWPHHEVCPCCSSPKIRPAFAKYQIMHWKCRRCAFLFVNPYPTDEILKELYDGSYYTAVRKYIEEPKVRKGTMDASMTAGFDCIKPIAEEVFRLKPKGTWLDIGGGMGGFAHAVRTWNPRYQVFLNELNEDSCRFARDFFKIDVLGCSLNELASQGHSFDVISMIGVLEHMSHPRDALAQIGQLLKPDGILALNVPRFSPLNALISRGASACAVPPFHLSLFNRRNLMICLKSAGLYRKIKSWSSGSRAFTMMDFMQYGDKWDLVVPLCEQESVRNIRLPSWSAEDDERIAMYFQLDAALAPFIETIDGKGMCNVLLRKAA